MAQSVAQRRQFANLPVEIVRSLMEHSARQVRRIVRAEHPGNLVERETSRFSHRDQLELQKYFGRKQATEAAP